MATQNPATTLVTPETVTGSLRGRPRLGESLIKGFLFLCGILSIFTTLAIIYILLEESVAFFSRTQWQNTNKAIAADVAPADEVHSGVRFWGCVGGRRRHSPEC
jgi:ABC-type phosphate transport system permease subunit